MNVTDFADGTPKFRMEDYFLGKTKGWGIFEDRFGNIRRQFQIEVTGHMDGDVLVMEEQLNYRDGETDHRSWRLTILDDGRYEGTTDSVIGVATGHASGNAFNWKYRMDLNVGDGDTWRVSFDDWMIQESGEIVVNRAWVKRWGFEIGSVTMFFTKQPPAQ